MKFFEQVPSDDNQKPTPEQLEQALLEEETPEVQRRFEKVKKIVGILARTGSRVKVTFGKNPG